MTLTRGAPTGQKCLKNKNLIIYMSSLSYSKFPFQIMYKQYLASLHKLGKRDVISAQHYAACVR